LVSDIGPEIILPEGLVGFP